MRLVLAVLALLVLAPAASAAPNVEIRRTSHGIPHIKGRDLLRASPTATATRSRRTTCARWPTTYVTVDGERSRYFGPDGSLHEPRQRRRPSTTSTRDFFFQRIKDDRVGREAARAAAAERAAARDPRGRARLRRRLQRLPARDRRRPASPTRAAAARRGCGRSPRSTPTGASTSSALLASSGVAIDGIARRAAADARAPAPPPLTAPATSASSQDGCRSATSAPTRSRWASAATGNGGGLLLGNPHFPWDGPERFYQAQLTIPGKVERRGRVAVRRADRADRPHAQPGVEPHGLDRVPLHAVRAQARAGLARRPTSSTASRRRCSAQTVTVQVPQAGRHAGAATRTLYSTRLRARSSRRSLGLPLFPWTPDDGVRDGRRQREQLPLAQPLLRDRPGAERRELDAIERRYQGIPWVNTIAADSAGRRYYADIGTVPQRDRRGGRSAATRALGAATFAALGLPVLDGSRAACAWGSDPDAVRARDPRAGADAVAVPRRLRHELQRLLLALEPGAPAGGLRPDHRRRAHRALAAHAARAADRPDQLDRRARSRRRCSRTPCSPTATRRRADARRLVGCAGRLPRCATDRSSGGVRGARGLGPARRTSTPGAPCCSGASRRGCWTAGRAGRRASGATPFDANDPVNTPRDLNTGDPRVQPALRGAVDDVNGLGKGLDVTLREVPVRAARRREDPDPRRAGRPRGRLQRDQRRRGCPARATRTCRTGRAS